ncbi:MAG TPA: hypothetical protein VE172_03720 [Stackebrandtia sp.]|uniref:hypothetical protein n=1 Tax=Stackebrandtia sp. TaxID=2023065 RepID=UPI002D280BE2|nr:hypothetical protein [Stackebrandtia sp.]HZE37897.1 hypothetical protein [Stackebrandtia sp.]
MGHPHRHASTARTSGAPTSNIDYKGVNVDVTDVRSFAKALIAEADHLGDHAGKVQKQLTNPGGKYEAVQPIGADPREHYLHNVATSQERTMGETAQLLKAVEVGMRNLGYITQRLVNAYGSEDGINAAGLDGVKSVIDSAHDESVSTASSAIERGGIEG